MTWTLFHECIFPVRHKLYRLALRLTGNAHEAEDIVQDVLEKVWRAPEVQTQQVQNWEAWCMTLTRNRSLDQTRQQARRRTTTLDQAPETWTESVSAAVENQEQLDQVRRLIQQLPEKQRTVLHLREVEEMPYADIAELLDIPLDQVKVTLHRARKTLRAALVEVL